MDTEIFVEMACRKCSKCGESRFNKEWKTFGKGPSPDLKTTCKKCKKEVTYPTSRRWFGDNGRRALTYVMFMLSILFSGSTWAKSATLFNLLEINPGSKSEFVGNFQDRVATAVDSVKKTFIMECRKKIADKQDTFVVIDAGWSHPGWWARECSITALDGMTGLPISVYHVIRDENYIGSSKGMEGFGVQKIMTELKNAGIKVTRVLHDKDSSTMKNAMEVFQDVQESLCLSKFFI
jgi:hypothetical protein